MTRFVDRGAIVAAWVGVGMAVTIAASFLLVIPIEPIYVLLALPSGLLIGYYANQRSDRREGPWRRIVANAAVAGVATGLAFAALLLLVKALFFFLDNGYRPENLGGSIPCAGGAECVYFRYLEDNEAALVAQGVTDPASFTAFYWGQQAGGAGSLLVLTLLGGLVGGLGYGLTRPKTPSRSPGETARA